MILTDSFGLPSDSMCVCMYHLIESTSAPPMWTLLTHETPRGNTPKPALIFELTVNPPVSVLVFGDKLQETDKNNTDVCQGGICDCLEGNRAGPSGAPGIVAPHTPFQSHSWIYEQFFTR